MEKQIVVREIKKTFHKKRGLFRKEIDKKVLRDISFDVAEGEILSIVGKNGAGKTTLIKIVSGIMKSDDGTVQILNENPFLKTRKYCKNVALIMGQKGQMDVDVSIYDNVQYIASIYNIDLNVVNEKIAEIAAELEIEKQLHQQVRTLSLGQRMKGELMISFIHEPKIIFLDEPTLGLDYASQKAIRKYLLRYVKQHHASVILTSHNIEDIEELSSRILILDQGQQLYYGSIDCLKKDFSTHKSIVFNSDMIDLKRNYQFSIKEVSPHRYRIDLADNDREIFNFLLGIPDVSDIGFEQDNLNDVIEKLYEKKLE